MPGPITQADMEAVFAVTDAMGIHRESVVVPLGRKDPGTVLQRGNEVQITLPTTKPVAEWVATLQAELEALGFEADDILD